MATSRTHLIEAAGGVLWRSAPGEPGVEVALVHRPKYDDWSLPKGKLDRGEHPLLAARREVAEETGFTALIGRPLQDVHYLKDGRPKRVRYWAMQCNGGEFRANDEVDQLMWLPPREAQVSLQEERDRPVMQEFAADPRATRAVVVVRHGSHSQAEMLAEVLEVYGIVHAYSSDTLRCLGTVGPFASQFHIPVESEPLLSESGYAAHPDAARQRTTKIFAVPESSVISTQRQVLPLFHDIARAMGYQPEEEFSLRKGGFLVFHLTMDDEPVVVAIERFPAR